MAATSTPNGQRALQAHDQHEAELKRAANTPEAIAARKRAAFYAQQAAQVREAGAQAQREATVSVIEEAIIRAKADMHQ